MIKRIISGFIRRSSNSRLEALKTLPRFHCDKFAVDRHDIVYTDPLSFYYEYKDIFEGRIYHFTSDNPAPFIIDAGGCIGMSVLYFKKIYPDANIIVFEPDPHIFSVLNRNVKVNSLSNVEMVHAGLSKKRGKLLFASDGADGGSAFQIASKKTIEVTTVCLSDYIDREVDLLKMNIEGMEGEVFEEIEGKLDLVKEIIFEYHCFHDLPQDLGKILNILDRKGFRYLVTDLTSVKIPVPFLMPDKYRYFNLVYAKRMK